MPSRSCSPASRTSAGDAGAAAATRLKVADLELDLLSRKASRAGHAIDLQPREFQLLETLMRHAGQVMDWTMLLEQVWNIISTRRPT